MNKVKYILIIGLIVSISISAKTGIIYTPADSVIFNKYISQLSPEREKPIGEIIVKTAKFFIGKPYVAHTLEIEENENLIINFRELDCTTFVETCIALSKVVKSGDHTLMNYAHILTQIRYRGGVVDGYTSRLHYISDWKYENEQNGILTDITLDIGGETIIKPITFMSSHSNAYKNLKNNDIDIEKIKEIERIIDKRNNYAVIPEQAIYSAEKQINDGDIIAFATSINGLDYSHIGIAYHEGKVLKFIHASSTARKVVIQDGSLHQYCKANKSQVGISVFRVQN